MGAYWKSKKIKVEPIGNHHVLVKTTLKMIENPLIHAFTIRSQEMKALKDRKSVEKFLLTHSNPVDTHSLRAWTLNNPLSGRDVEVKLGMAVEKKGIPMRPNAFDHVWFVLVHGKKWMVSTRILSMDEHLFPYQDAKLTEENTITRSGKKLRFLLTRLDIDVNGKRGVDLGCGSGGWTHTLLEKGAEHITAIDRTMLDKRLQKNKRVAYIPEKAEKSPKIKGKIDFIVQDINVGPDHAKKIFLEFDKKNPGAKEALITLKIMRGKDLEKIPKIGTKWGKWKVKGLANTWWARRECYVYLTK